MSQDLDRLTTYELARASAKLGVAPTTITGAAAALEAQVEAGLAGPEPEPEPDARRAECFGRTAGSSGAVAAELDRLLIAKGFEPIPGRAL